MYMHTYVCVEIYTHMYKCERNFTRDFLSVSFAEKAKLKNSLVCSFVTQFAVNALSAHKVWEEYEKVVYKPAFLLVECTA